MTFRLPGRLIAVLLLGCALAAVAAESPTKQGTASALVRTVADAVVRDFTNTPPFDWGEGVLLAGMIEAHRVTHNPRYLQFVDRFAEHWNRQGIGPLLAAKGYCGHWGPGFALVELHELTSQDAPLKLANAIIDFILKKATRTSDGGLDHFTGKPELWVDTLAMCCPLLSREGRVHERPELQAEARQQLRIFARHLQDPATGLFYHHWSETKTQATTNFWARGNGWVALSLLETLRNEPVGDRNTEPLRQMLGKQMASVLKIQDPATGLWHTVLDAPETYLETSASAMFLCTLAEGRRLKLLSPPESAMASAWSGLSRQVDGSGKVIGVSGGTGPSPKAGYANVPTGTYTWGTGAFLLAASAWNRMEHEARNGN